ILSHTAFSWDLAKTMCRDAGGGLVSIPSKEVGDAIATFYNNSNDRWEWADGAEMRHTNWAVGEPHIVGSLDRCGYMGLRAPEIGTWRNDVCAPETSTNFDVICERVPFEISNGGAPPPPNLPAPPPPVQCPEGWLYLQASNLCYAVMEPREDQFTWNEARSVCTEAGGDLVSIPNRNVQDALILLAADAEFVRGPEPNKNWVLLAIGASYNDTIDQWEWSDGADMRYTNWHNVDEYGPVDGCAYMRLAPTGVGTWQKMDCLHGGGDWARLCERSAFDI
ncbi:macrophage mannose receptor 1-like, partial [Aphelenchoides avenae]